MSSTLYVGGVAFSTTNERLFAIFSEVAPVTCVTLATDRSTGLSRGFGIVQMASVAAAETAIASLDRRDVDGRAIRVQRVHATAGAGDDSCR